MKCWVDLHIHSCLSPCAENDMTPNNIINMSLLKGLDIIAITDHNSVRNAETLVEVGKRAGIMVVPGMELCTAEEIHLICLFPDLIQAFTFEKIVYENLSPLKNREDIFGSQIIMDINDQEIGREDRLLSAACNLDADSAIKMVRELGGAVFPAHVDRESFSMLNTLGTIPEEYSFHYLECSKNSKLHEFLQKYPELAKYQYIHSSDAHFLGDILEQEVCLDLEEKSIKGLLKLFA